MADAVIKAETRQDTGKGTARRLRREGRIPAVIYAGGRDIRISVDQSELERFLSQGGPDRSLDLDLGPSGKRTVLVKALQRHPVTGEILHADFHEVDSTAAPTAQAAVQPAAGEAAGGRSEAAGAAAGEAAGTKEG